MKCTSAARITIAWSLRQAPCTHEDDTTRFFTLIPFSPPKSSVISEIDKQANDKSGDIEFDCNANKFVESTLQTIGGLLNIKKVSLC